VTHRFLDAGQPSPSPQDIAGAGMEDLLPRLHAQAADLPRQGALPPAQAQGFVVALGPLTPEQVALVGNTLAKMGHVTLLRALHTTGRAHWDAATSVALLLSYHDDQRRTPLTTDTWALARETGTEATYLRCTGNTQALPLDGWIWLAQQAASDPGRALGFFGAPPYTSRALAGYPSPTTPEEEQAYGAAVATLYRALLSVCTHPGHALSSYADLAIALLAGWPADLVCARATTVVDHALAFHQGVCVASYEEQHQGRPSEADIPTFYAWRWHRVGSSVHARLRLAHEVAQLAPEERHGAIAALCAPVASRATPVEDTMRHYARHPVLARLFLPPT